MNINNRVLVQKNKKINEKIYIYISTYYLILFLIIELILILKRLQKKKFSKSSWRRRDDVFVLFGTWLLPSMESFSNHGVSTGVLW